MGVGLPIGGGIGGLVLLLLFSALTGQNPADLISQGNEPGTTGTAGAREDDTATQFVSTILADTEETWTQLFSERNATYQPATLVLFTGSTNSPCGLGQSAMGPFYCPSDRKVYLDLSFFEELARMGGAGDFAAAYVVAHEIGHHVQTLTGVSQRVANARQRGGEVEANALSVQQELQADCFAGVWGHYAARKEMLEAGDADEGLRAAAAIGDDRLQRQGQGRVVPESFTHGSSQQRMTWLRRGMDAGLMDACDTFSSGT